MAINLIIGCGGSGLTTMSAVNRLLAQNPLILPRMCDEIYYLAVDTERDALDKFEKDVKEQMGNYPHPYIQRLQLSDGVNILNEIIKPYFVDPFTSQSNDNGLARLREQWWFDGDGNPFTAPKVTNLILGAGQCPPASYALAWANLRDIGEKIKRMVDRMIGRGNGDPNQLKNMNLFVVAGLSGGTGRGCWSLITFKIREYLLDNYNITVPPVGIFFDANVFDCVANDNQAQRLALEVNSATGLSELSCWMENGGNAGKKRYEYRLPDMESPGIRETDVLKVDLDINPGSGAPVGSAYLICGRSASAILDNNRQYHEMAGAAIYAMIANTNIQARSVNDGDPFNSLGAATFEVDTLHIRNYFEARARGIALGRLATAHGSVDSAVSRFFADHPVNIVPLTDLDIKANPEGNIYQRAVAHLLADKKVQMALGTIASEMKDWKLSDAEENIEPLIQPAKDADIAAAVQNALKGFGQKDGDGRRIGLDGRKGEEAVSAAMKEVYAGAGDEKPSVGRAMEFLKQLKADIETALSRAPASMAMTTGAISDAKAPSEAISATLKIYSKRTFKEILNGTGAFNADEISGMVSIDGAGGCSGEIPKAIALANYPKLKAAFAEAFAPMLAKIDKLIRACEQFANCCREARSAFALEEPTAAGGTSGDDAFELLFATPDKIDRTLCDADDRSRFYRRILTPIVESREELEGYVSESINVGDGMGDFINRAVADGTLEKLGADKGGNSRQKFIGELMDKTRANVSLSDNFMEERFTFEKVLERNCVFWNTAIEAAQGSGVRRRELEEKFAKTLGAVPRIDKRNPKAPPRLPELDELKNCIAASLASTCAPWWIAETSGAHHSIMMFVPYEIDQAKFQETLTAQVPHTKVQGIGLGDATGSATPFSYVAFVSEGLLLKEVEKKQKKHLLDKVKSLTYYQHPEVNAWLQKAEDPAGESIFTTDNHNKGIGYLSPIFVRDKKLANYRWKPWMKEDEAEAASAEGKALDAILYALLGTGLSEAQAKAFEEKLAPYGWSLPAIRFMEKGQIWQLARKTLVWDDDENKGKSNVVECSWKGGWKICTSTCNLLPMFEGKGKTGKNGELKQADVDNGNKLRGLIQTEAEAFEEHVKRELGADFKKLENARKDWLGMMRDNADEEDESVFDALLKRSQAK